MSRLPSPESTEGDGIERPKPEQLLARRVFGHERDPPAVGRYGQRSGVLAPDLESRLLRGQDRGAHRRGFDRRAAKISQRRERGRENRSSGNTPGQALPAPAPRDDDRRRSRLRAAFDDPLELELRV